MEQITQGRVTPKISMEFFGTPSFLHWSWSKNGKWTVFSNVEFKATPEIPHCNAGFFHGTCLSACNKILSEQRFRVGLFRSVGSKQHPTGIWGCSHPGEALDRSPLTRSWSYRRERKMSLWDVPVAILLPISQRDFCKVVSLSFGYQRMVIPYPAGTHMEITGPIQVWIHSSLYSNFESLNSHWDSVANGTMVACRAPPGDPASLYRCGECHPMTCGRTIPAATVGRYGWTEARNSKEWMCRECATLSSLCHANFDDV